MQKTKNIFIFFILGIGFLTVQACMLFQPASFDDKPAPVAEERYDYLIVNKLDDSGTRASVRANPDYIRSVSTVYIPAQIRGMTISEIEQDGFKGYTSITEVVFPNSINNIADSAFANCTALSRIRFSESITSIEQSAFSGCTSLNSVSIPPNVSKIRSNAFYLCSNLSSINFGSGASLEIGTRSFGKCALSSVTITSRVSSIGSSAFEGCRSLDEIRVQSSTPPILGTAAFIDTKLSKLYVPSVSYRTASGWSNYAKIMIVQ